MESCYGGAMQAGYRSGGRCRRKLYGGAAQVGIDLSGGAEDLFVGPEIFLENAGPLVYRGVTQGRLTQRESATFTR